MDVGAMLNQHLDHLKIPSLRCDVYRAVAGLCPGKVGVGAVLQEPTYTCRPGGGVNGPAHDVTQWRDAAGDTVDVDLKTIQQFQCGEIAGCRSNMCRDTVCRICSAFKQYLRECQMIGRT